MIDSPVHVLPHEWQEASITRIDVQTPTVKSFVLRPRVWHPFLAGQHVDVRLTAPDGYAAHRSYSICSAPDDSGTIELAIEELPDGEVSPYFHEVAEVGDVIETRGPFTTHFAWRPAEHGDVLLIGGGSGIAPLMSMLRLRARLEHAPGMTFVYSARSWDDVIFREELLRHEREQTGLRMSFALTRDASNAPNGRAADFTRRLDSAAIAQIIESAGANPSTVFVCGSNAFVGAVADGLVATGIPPESIRTERYGG